MFIVFEGIDGCGKTTHVKLLGDWLEKKGYEIVLTVEPTKSGIGKLIREILSGELTVNPETLALLFTADRMEHVREIKEQLQEEKTVISDRYHYSTIAYQSAQGVDIDWLKTLNDFIIKPDLSIFLDVPLDESDSRNSGEEIFEKKEFLTKVRKNYENFNDLTILDATGSISETQEKIRNLVSTFIEKNTPKSI